MMKLSWQMSNSERVMKLKVMCLKKKIKSHVVHMKQQHEIVNWDGSFKHRFIYLLVMWLR